MRHHQVVGRVAKVGDEAAQRREVLDRIGITDQGSNERDGGGAQVAAGAFGVRIPAHDEMVIRLGERADDVTDAVLGAPAEIARGDVNDLGTI
jgi:hypothetical protein